MIARQLADTADRREPFDDDDRPALVRQLSRPELADLTSAALSDALGAYAAEHISDDAWPDTSLPSRSGPSLVCRQGRKLPLDIHTSIGRRSAIGRSTASQNDATTAVRRGGRPVRPRGCR